MKLCTFDMIYKIKKIYMHIYKYINYIFIVPLILIIIRIIIIRESNAYLKRIF